MVADTFSANGAIPACETDHIAVPTMENCSLAHMAGYMKIQRGIPGLIACVVALAMILVAMPRPARAASCFGECCADDDCSGAFCDTRFRTCFPRFENARPLINVGSGKCFEPTPRLKPLGFVVSNEGRPPWYCPTCIALGADGFFILAGTGKCVDARDGAKSDHSVVQQWECRELCTSHPFECKPDKNARSMIWYIERGDFSGPDWHSIKLKNVNSDLCLDVRAGSSDEFAQLQQYHCTSNNAAQNFRQTFQP
jgi:Ricin-type beta-trefoil lectin domain-like